MFFIFFPLFSSRCSHYYSHTHHQSSQHTRYCIPPPLSLSAAVCVSVHACVISCSAMACTGSEESLWMVSFNQIVLQIGEDEDGRRGAVRDTCHSPFHSCLIWRKLHQPSYQHLQLYFIIFQRPLHLLHKCQSHFVFARPQNINKHFSQTYVVDGGVQRQGFKCTKSFVPFLPQKHISI